MNNEIMADAVNQETMKDIAQKIWNIAKISSGHGNALMDILGDDVYDNVMRLANE